MLILSRKENQTIVVGEDIVITVCNLSGGRVRLGIHAPDDVNIRRGELHASQRDNHRQTERVLVTN